ncbi:MAG: polysaccharide biosynthesis tyrosine autokinase, partial [Silvibacterium sp.]|nr:polysaccharide biosynthesis tyrosine autokinase [Silvibacterium sp.]
MNTKPRLRVLELDDLYRPERREWTLIDLFAVFRRRRAFVIWWVGALLVLATAYCLLATRRYRATGQIEVQKESPGVFGLQSSVMGNAQDSDADSLDYSMTLETEARILQSGELSLQVIKDLNLETTRDYFPSRPSGLRIPQWLLFWKKPVEPLSVPIDDAPNRRYVALKIFTSHLKVAPVVGTRLIEISYSDPDPRLAASVVNRLVQALMDYSFQARFNATAQASGWLAGQLVGLRKQTEALQEKATRLQRDTGIFGEGEAHNVVLARLESLNEALIAAESNRILKEAIYKASQSGDPELISGLAGNSTAGTTSAMTNSLALIQTLRGQEAAVRAEIAEDDTKYGAAFPRLAELHAQLDGIEKSIQDEVHRIGERSRTDFEIASQAERSAMDSFEKQKKMANETNDKAIAYSLARQEADASRGIYQGLLAKLKEAGILEGLRSTNLTVVNPARVPPTNHPQSPNIPIYYAAALTMGLFAGCSSALARELQDRSIRSPQELEEMLGARLLGVIPRVSRDRSLLTQARGKASAQITAPRVIHSVAAARDTALKDSPFLEALRSVRTSLLSWDGERAPQVLLVTSSVTGEGKSKLTANLALVLAQLDARVLLVDADLRCPTLQKELNMTGAAGLGAVLFDGIPAVVHNHPDCPALSVLCGSSTPALPSELLASQRMRDLLSTWRAEYDFILLDSPPVLPVADARILAGMCDATLLVARHGFTSRQAIQRSHQLIQQQMPEHAMIGAVLNGLSVESADYYEYYGYT